MGDNCDKCGKQTDLNRDDIAEGIVWCDVYSDNEGKPVRLYRPSNGTEGDCFMGAFCDQCVRNTWDDETRTGGCDILMRTMAYDVDDPEYPREWNYGPHGPSCTAFSSKDQGY